MRKTLSESTPLSDIARVFLRLGTVAFGGPAAHIAMMEEEVVRRRGWLTRDQFLDYLGATNLIPGPNSTELAIHIGHARAGWPGLLIAGLSFILPAVAIVTAVAWAYVTYGALPQVTGVLYGVKPVVVAVVAQALWGLGRTAVKTAGLGLLALATIVALWAGVNELVVLVTAGAVCALARAFWTSGRSAIPVAVAAGAGVAAHDVTLGAGALGATFATGATGAMAPFGLWPLFLVFAKIGAVLFGSGYVLLAFLRADLVQRLGWLTERQLLDAAVVGQVTPGPVFTSATFIGYILGGPAGAAVATVAIFLPAFLFVAVSGPLVPRLRRSPIAAAMLDGVNVASLALMAVVIWQLGRTAVPDLLTMAITAASLFLLVRYRVNSAWLILGAGLLGWIGAH